MVQLRDNEECMRLFAHHTRPCRPDMHSRSLSPNNIKQKVSIASHQTFYFSECGLVDNHKPLP